MKRRISETIPAQRTPLLENRAERFGMEETMRNANASGTEELAGIGNRIRSELETLREITQILDRNWKGPAADLVKKELGHAILILDEQSSAVRKVFSEQDKVQQEETQHGK